MPHAGYVSLLDTPLPGLPGLIRKHHDEEERSANIRHNQCAMGALKRAALKQVLLNSAGLRRKGAWSLV